MPRMLRIALIGQGFMGRAHSNGWGQVGRFFDPPRLPVLHTICGRDAQRLREFAARWGWLHADADWKEVVGDGAVDLVDVSSPNRWHAPMAIAALAAGKAVACEKPLAASLAEARDMAARARDAGLPTFVWYNYRRCPAVALAHQLVKQGRVGEIRHVRAVYLQDWAKGDVPMNWRFDKREAGSGAHGDLSAHIIDMTRFVTGQEITEICGAIAETFIKKRAVEAGGEKARLLGKVTVDDTVLFLARFSGGAVASFEAARQATGNQNRNGFEINGTQGALRFNFERMNELEFYDATAPRTLQGWTNILCTHGPSHPYVSAWWPDAHLLGYEHGFVNMAYDICRVMAGQKPIVPLPDFEDAYQTQRVMEAALISARTKKWVELAKVK
jgi:predicted dehydrogenase